MSFDIFVECYSKGCGKSYPRRIVEDAFKAFIYGKEKARGGEYLLLSFGDGGKARVFLDDTQDTSGFMVNRPPASPEFWKAIIEIMKATDSVLWWPGSGCVITNPAVRDDLPKEMLAVMGEPTVTEDIDAVHDCIERG